MQPPSESSSSSSSDEETTSAARTHVRPKAKVAESSSSSSSSSDNSSSSSSSTSSDEQAHTPKRRVMGRPFSGGGSRPASSGGSSGATPPATVVPAPPAVAETMPTRPTVAAPAVIADPDDDAVPVVLAEHTVDASHSAKDESDASVGDADAGATPDAADGANLPRAHSPTAETNNNSVQPPTVGDANPLRETDVNSADPCDPAPPSSDPPSLSTDGDSTPQPEAPSGRQLLSDNLSPINSVAPEDATTMASGVVPQPSAPPDAEPGAAPPADAVAVPASHDVHQRSRSSSSCSSTSSAPPPPAAAQATEVIQAQTPVAAEDAPTHACDAASAASCDAAAPTVDDNTPPEEPSVPAVAHHAFVTQQADLLGSNVQSDEVPVAAAQNVVATAYDALAAPPPDEGTATGYSDDEYESDASPTKSATTISAEAPARVSEAPPVAQQPSSASPSPDRRERTSSSASSCSSSSSSSYVPLAASLSQRALSESSSRHDVDETPVGSATKAPVAHGTEAATTGPSGAPPAIQKRPVGKSASSKGTPRGTTAASKAVVTKGSATKPASRQGPPQNVAAGRNQDAPPTTHVPAPTTPSQHRTTPIPVVRDGEEVLVDTPRHVTADDTVHQLFVRSVRNNTNVGGSTHHQHHKHTPNGTMTSQGTAASGASAYHSSPRITDVRRWIRPYETPVGHHTRLVLRDVVDLEEQRKREVEVYRAKVLERDEEDAKRKEAAEQQPKRTVSEASPRLCRPKHQGPKVGPYAPRPPTSSSAPLSNTGSEATLRRGGSQRRRTQTSFYGYDATDSDSIPHFMRPLPPRKEPKPLTFQPQIHAFRSGEEGGEDDGPVPLTAEEFAQRFYQQQLAAHASAIDKAYVKVTGSPKPPTPPPSSRGRGPRRGVGAEAAAADDAADDDEDDEDDEKRQRLEEFDREMGRKHHDEEVANRHRRNEMLVAKYIGSSGQRAATRSGSRPTAALTVAEQRFVDAMYTLPLKHQRDTLAALWDAMERRTDAESVHHGVHMTQSMWDALLARIRSAN